jgi:hypothetical protein
VRCLLAEAAAHTLGEPVALARSGPPTAAPAAKSGGARRDRTDDLLLAKQALSQLSYGPCRDQASIVRYQERRASRYLTADHHRHLELVGLGRFELPTSRLSSARSNQLSYKPEPGVSIQKPVIRSLLITDH